MGHGVHENATRIRWWWRVSDRAGSSDRAPLPNYPNSTGILRNQKTNNAGFGFGFG